jgi:hypothetical protein
MPILRVDQFGRLYESSPDRADGLGYGGHAPGVTQGDSTYGASYLKSQQQYQRDVMRDKAMQVAQDREDAVKREQARRQAIERQRREAMESNLMDNPRVKNAMIKRGLAMGCNCGVTPRPDKTQQAIKQFMNTGRSSLAGRISKDEALQLAHAQQAQATFARQAQMQAQFDRQVKAREDQVKRLKMQRQAYDASPSKVLGRR